MTDVVLTHMHMDHIGGLLVDGEVALRPDLRVHLAAAEAEFWEAPDFSARIHGARVPDVLRSTATQFLNVYRGQLRTFETEYEVAPGVHAAVPAATPPGTASSASRPVRRLTFAGDAVFQIGFENPEWQNGFEHDPRRMPASGSG